MKKEVSKPVLFGVIALAVVIAVFLFMRAGGGSAEFKGPEVTNKTIPAHIYDALPEAERKKMEADGFKRAEGTPATPAGGPPKQNPYPTR